MNSINDYAGTYSSDDKSIFHIYFLYANLLIKAVLDVLNLTWYIPSIYDNVPQIKALAWRGNRLQT